MRIPAASCGLFGFKPTRARLPDGPFVGEGWAGMAIDGFLTRSVRDTAAMLDACEGADPGAPYWAPPLGRGHMAAISRPPQGLRVGIVDTTFTGEPIHPEVAEAVRAAGRLLESLGHRVEPVRIRADVAGMMQAWTDIVAVGTALGIRRALKGRTLTDDLVEGVGRGAVAHAETLHPTRYLEAVGAIHAFGREMAAVFAPEAGGGPDILCRPRWPNPGQGRPFCPCHRGLRRLSHGSARDFRLFALLRDLQCLRSASGQPAAGMVQRRPAHRRPSGRRFRPGRGADRALRGSGTRLALGGQTRTHGRVTGKNRLSAGDPPAQYDQNDSRGISG
ncbi:hypothetical protein MASR1M32_36640 [Rhodobacter sp.]